MNLAFHASDRGSNPSLATIFYFFFFFCFCCFYFDLFFFSFLSLSASTIRQLLHLGINSQKAVNTMYFVLFTEIQPFLEFTLTIMQTSPCNEYPLTPHFYIVKLGFTGVYIFFLFLLYNIDRGYSLDSNVYQQSMF